MIRARADIIVLGAGAMGSAAAYHCARHGRRVILIEQHDIGHDLGSSHGRSRVIRKAYFEDARYVPLLHAAYREWRSLETECGEMLLHLVGCLNIGPPDHPAIRGVFDSARQHGLPHEGLSADAIRQRWPVFEPNDGDVGLFETEAGFVSPETCVRVHLEAAMRRGAQVRTREPVVAWEATPRCVRVTTTETEYECERLVIAAGPWLPQVAPELNLPLHVERQVQLWFMPVDPEPVRAPNMPSFIHFVSPGAAYYGIPMQRDEGVKVARHHAGSMTRPDSVDRAVTADDEADIRGYIRRHLPPADGPRVDGKVCLYTNTPDENFIIDRHPAHENVLLAGGFSGHGFKFASVVGAILADLAIQGRTQEPIEFLSIGRFRA